MDPRDVQARCGNWYQSFDETSMKLVVVVSDDEGGEREVAAPAHYEVCSLCNGKGTHVNPSIDCHGISAEEMDDLGSDFEEEYFGGTYDVSCYRCKGRRVEPVVSWKKMKPEHRELVEEALESHNEYVRECVRESRYMGEY